MSHPQAVAYIKNELAAGKPVDGIKEALRNSGWETQVIEDSLSEAQSIQITEYTRFLGPIELFKKTWDVFNQNRNTYLVLFIPLIVLSALIALLTPTDQNNNLPAPTMMLLGIISLIGGIFSFYISVVVDVALARRKEKISALTAMTATFPILMPYILVYLLMAFVSMGAFIFLIIPGVIVSLMTLFAPFILVVEKIGGMEALVRSRAYTRGRLLGIFGRLLVLIIPLSIVYVVLSAFGPFANIANPLYTLFFSIYLFVMYENLRALRPNVNSKQGGKTRTYFTILACLGPVIAFIGIASAITLLALNPAGLLRASRDATRMSDLSTLQKNIDLYYAENTVYPETLNQLSSDTTILVVDPKTTLPYEYRILPDGSGYEICATMEDRTKYPESQKCLTN